MSKASSYKSRSEASNRIHKSASAAARDIGNGWPKAGNHRRREACKNDLRKFLETYFPQAFPLAWSADHLRVIDRIQKCVIDGGQFAMAMPRGSGKTTMSTRAAIWALLFGHRRFVVLIAATEKDAEKLLDDIKTELQFNDWLSKDFRNVCHPLRKLEGDGRRAIGQLCDGERTLIESSNRQLTLPTVPAARIARREIDVSGATVTVAGITGAIRGQKHTLRSGVIIRPDLVLLDDPQTRESAGSPTQNVERLAILNGDVLGMAGPGRRIAALCTLTVVFPDDMADQILDRDRNPQWHGERTKLLYAMPTNEKLWHEYGKRLSDEQRRGGNGKEATEFYGEHRAEMDAGAIVAWPERKEAGELSALQSAMNLKLRNESAFWAEYQNEPRVQAADETTLTPARVASRGNGRARGVAGLELPTLTGFIDVHDSLLYWMVCGWRAGFCGEIIDYGTWPGQKREWFTLLDARRTLAMEYPGAGIDGAIQAGLSRLSGDLARREWGRPARLDKLLIDSGYKPKIVANVVRQVGGVAMASKGVGVKAGNMPMTAYQRRPGWRLGNNWVVPAVSGTQEFPHVLIDANWWKSFVHARLTTAPGDPGALTLFGNGGHELVASHIAGSETYTVTHGRGRTVQEWSHRPERPDNHWFDCLVGCAVGASMCGVRLGVEVGPPPKRKVRLSELVARRKDGKAVR